MKLEGKTAVVSGGSSGIGFATAHRFVQEGARVVILGRDRGRLEKAVGELGAASFGVEVDVSDVEALAGGLSQASGHLGGIDILFANAGNAEAPPFAETTPASFDAMMGLNVRGTVFTVLYSLPHFREGASIILTGSVASRKGGVGDPIYAATKGAVRSFGRNLAFDPDIIERRIRVNIVTPGPIHTPLVDRAIQGDEAVMKHVASMVPMKRWGAASEVAEAVLFLASAASSYMTGAEITVDGGLAHV